MSSSLKALVALMRPGNCVMSAGGVLAGAIVARGMAVVDFALQIALAALAALLVTGAGNALNDYYDREVDKKNHPERPIPSGTISPKGALYSAVVLFAVGILFSVFVNVACIIVAIVNSVALVAYERDLKARGLVGNIAIAYLVSSIFLFGGAAVGSMLITAMLVLTSFFATLGREIIKDVEDIEGDVGRHTLPMSIGIKGANSVAASAIVGAVAMSPLPYAPLALFSSPAYLAIVIFADAIFIYVIAISFSKPKQASRMAKFAMMFALVAFLAGGLLR